MNLRCRADAPGPHARNDGLSGVLLCMWLLGFASPALSIELIHNGSFEEGGRPGTSIVLSGWDDGAGIDSDIGFVQLNYAISCGDELCTGVQYIAPGPPSSGVSGPLGRGGWYAADFGRGNGRPPQEIFGSATQHVILDGHAGSLFEFSTWFASDIDDSDFATATLEFFSAANATGDSLGGILLDGNDQQSSFIVGSANEQGIADPAVPATQDNWTFYRASGRIPLNAASAAVVLRDGTVTGVNADGGYVDLVSLQVLSETPGFPGDYNGNDEVEQGDLDLVLLHWGRDAIVAPDGWIRNLPGGPVDQAELDAVLLNWGNTQRLANGAGTVPEPSTLSLVVALLPFVIRRLRGRARHEASLDGPCETACGRATVPNCLEDGT